MNFSDDYVDLSPMLDAEPLEDALIRIFEQELQVPRPGGASSGKGWSAYSTFMDCPYRFYRRYREPLIIDPNQNPLAGRKPLSLEIGGLYHQFNALRALEKMGKAPCTADWLHDRLLTATKVSPEVIRESWRLYSYYCAVYENDVLVPLAVEEAFKSEVTGNTCRFDEIALVEDTVLPLWKGTWIVEKKTTARLDVGATEGWKNDGEILGQVAIWDELGLDDTFGELAGVVVDLIVKTKVPKVERIVLPRRSIIAKMHTVDLEYWAEQIANSDRDGRWPRKRSACIGRFGKCEIFDHCAVEETFLQIRPSPKKELQEVAFPLAEEPVLPPKPKKPRTVIRPRSAVNYTKK